MIISFSGIDGSGKTTASRGLVRELQKKGYKVKYFHVDEYILLGPVVKVFKLLLIRGQETVKNVNVNPFLGAKHRPWYQKLWLLLVILDNWIYFLKLKYYSLKGYVVVCDRYFYDRLAGFVYHGYSSEFLYRLYFKTTPHQVYKVFLNIPPEIAIKRETDDLHDIEFFRRMDSIYNKIFGEIHDVSVVSEENPLDFEGLILSYVKGSGLGSKRSKVWVVGFVSLVLFGLFLSDAKSIYNTLFTKLEISPEANALFDGDPRLFAPPISQENIILGDVTEKYPGVILIPFRQPVELDGFSLFFWGNLHIVTSYMPESFDVLYKEEGKDWRLAEEVRGYNKNTYTFLLDNSKSIEAFSVVVTNAPFDFIVRVGDLQLLKRQNTDLFTGMSLYLEKFDKSFLARLSYSVVFLTILIIPGFVFLSFVGRKLKNHDEEEKLMFAPIFTMTILIISGILFYLFGSLNILVLYLIIFALSFAYFVMHKQYKFFKGASLVLCVMFMFLAVTIFIQNYRENLFNLPYIEHYLDYLNTMPIKGFYGYHTDNTLPWATSRAFLRRVSIFSDEAANLRMEHPVEAVLDRPPILSFMLVPIIKIFGESHFVYQQFMNVLAAMFYGAAFVMVSKYFSKKIAMIVAVLLLLNVYLTWEVTNVEVFYKYFAVYITFLALILFKSKNWRHKHIFIGFLLALSVAVHPMSVIFLGSVGVYYLLTYKVSKSLINNSITAFIFPVLVLVIFALITSSVKVIHLGELSEDKNLYMGRFTAMNPDLLKNKVVNVLNIFVPDSLVKGYQPWINEQSVYEYMFIKFLRVSLLSATTPLLFIAGILSLKTLRRYEKELFLGVSPLAFYIIYMHIYSFGGHVALYPFALPLLLGYLVAGVQVLSARFRFLIYLSYSVFMFLNLYFISWIFNDMKYVDVGIQLSFWAILILYLFLSLCLLYYTCVSCYEKNE